MHGKARSDWMVPAAIAIVAAGAVVALWEGLRRDHESRVANVAEATSYATRSELARRLLVQFQSFRELADAWAARSAQDRSAASAEAALELVRFEGVETIAWGDIDGDRLLVTGADPASAHVPTPEEWAPVRASVDEAIAAAAEVVDGPFLDPENHAVFRYLLPVRREAHRGGLVVIIDTHDLLAALLVDESLGYEIRVSCCEGVELYRRGTADNDLPGAWARDGWITPGPGLRWNVSHRPSAELADDLETAAVDSVLIVGLALALLLGALVFETMRANERAAAARSAETNVRILNRELEERVVGRTQELVEMLDDQNTINLSVSHDLRSPLNTISLAVGQLREEAAGSDRQIASYCDKTTAAIRSMVDVLDRMLEHSRVAAFDSDLEEVDMRALVEQVVGERMLDRRAVTIGALPSVRADRMMVYILLDNLLGNAIRHGGRGRKLRLVIGSVQTEEGETAYFVEDNGPGLDADEIDDLFKPVKRPAGARRTEGLGLGLAIAARVVARHRGRIWVESAPGRGARFLFTLRVPAADTSG